MSLTLAYAVESALNVLDMLAQQTKTRLDDELVDVLRVIHEERIVCAWLDGFINVEEDDDETIATVAVPRSGDSVDMPSEVSQAFNARGISPETVQAWLPIILSIVSQIVTQRR